MRGTLRSVLAFSVLAVAALAAAVAARAEIVTARDNAGRAITFDVRATGVDVEWYASLLRNAPHGNEISTVTVRVVDASDISSICGTGAAACYGGRLMIVPAGRDSRTAHSLLHEYGHHLDYSWPVAGVREPNGTPQWWQARGIAGLVAEGALTYDYSLGWNRSIGEVFAEDYTYTQLAGRYGIDWLGPPDAALQAALLAELRATVPGAVAPPAAPPPATRPVVVTRGGLLAPGQRRAIPFRLLGPGRRVTFTGAVDAARRGNAEARLEIICEDTELASRVLSRASRTARLDVADLGPTSCEAALVNTGRSALRYRAQLRLAVQQSR